MQYLERSLDQRLFNLYSLLFIDIKIWVKKSMWHKRLFSLRLVPVESVIAQLPKVPRQLDTGMKPPPSMHSFIDKLSHLIVDLY